jgi:hypothetical protein
MRVAERRPHVFRAAVYAKRSSCMRTRVLQDQHVYRWDFYSGGRGGRTLLLHIILVGSYLGGKEKRRGAIRVTGVSRRSSTQNWLAKLCFAGRTFLNFISRRKEEVTKRKNLDGMQERVVQINREAQLLLPCQLWQRCSAYSKFHLW